jgi:PTH2 family peptidyl-tRNA hydrolase
MEKKIQVGHKMVIITSDIEMSPGKLAAQVAHAAVECTLKSMEKKPKKVKKWLREGQKKIIVKTNQEEMEKLENLARQMNLQTAVIRDAGHTELESGTLTAIAIGPASEVELNKVTGQLKLR